MLENNAVRPTEVVLAGEFSCIAFCRGRPWPIPKADFARFSSTTGERNIVLWVNEHLARGVETGGL